MAQGQLPLVPIVSHNLLPYFMLTLVLVPTPDNSGNSDLDKNENLTIQKNHGGWVNPQDLMPMPQCIAQQDPSSWLEVMTKCTRHRCTSHFGLICTHSQWLTQLSCLAVEFSPSVIEEYVAYCSRSILVKAQLYQWIYYVTGRTWLVAIGDTNELQILSPDSLIKGYGAIADAVAKAPACLQNAVSYQAKELFQHTIGSCSFTSKTLHTGNPNRPWEYSSSRKSMTALSFDTVGYDMTETHIPPGQYFDRECFCSTFAIDKQDEPCSTSDSLALTKERMWLNATCGTASLPDHWTPSLKVLGLSYIALEDWRLPTHIKDMPKEVMHFSQKCTTDACQVDSDGYCQVASAIDRSCLCRNVNYDLCQGSCQALKVRRQYIYWLQGLCGDVEGWHGLPDAWREVIAPQRRDMIPRQLTLTSRTTGRDRECPSNWWKIASVALVNLVTLLAVFSNNGRTRRDTTVSLSMQSRSPRWCLGGLYLASLQLLANLVVVNIIRSTPGYEDTHILQLMLFWCLIPRLGWLTCLPLQLYHPSARILVSTTSALFAEVVLQGFSFYYMIMTVNYGWQNGFYHGGLAGTKEQGPALLMYAGALIWVLMMVMMAVPLARTIQAVLNAGSHGRNTRRRPPGHDGSNHTPSGDGEATVHETLLAESHWRAPLKSGDFSYGTLPVTDRSHALRRGLLIALYRVMAMAVPLLWLSQWLFWAGFAVLSSEE